MITSLCKTFLEKIPMRSFDLTKGDLGNIAVFGGSFEYTGAPYFAAVSALEIGADLSYIFCPESAAVPIKSYSPDIIVIPILENNLESCKRWLKKMNSVVFGPGLGRNPCDENLIEILKEIKALEIPTIIDADGINFLLRNKKSITLSKNFVLTPNKLEFGRISEHLGLDGNDSVDNSIKLMSEFFDSATVIRKGQTDLIFTPELGSISQENLRGSCKRCGGQGDIFDGILAVYIYWAIKNNLKNPISSASAAAVIKMRDSAANAYNKHGTSLTASKIIEFLHTS